MNFLIPSFSKKKKKKKLCNSLSINIFILVIILSLNTDIKKTSPTFFHNQSCVNLHLTSIMVQYYTYYDRLHQVDLIQYANILYNKNIVNN